MTIQQAYNKGLDDAENLAVVKFSNALLGNDDGPFNNSQMEDLRQKILEERRSPKVEMVENENYALKVFLDQEIDETKLSSLDLKVLVFLRHVFSLRDRRSKFGVKLRKLLSDLRIDFVNNYDKL